MLDKRNIQATLNVFFYYAYDRVRQNKERPAKFAVI